MTDDDAFRIMSRELAGRLLCVLAIFAFCAFTHGCTSIDMHTAAPGDWPDLQVIEHEVSHAEMRDNCARWSPWYSSPEACAVINFATLRCDIWTSKDFPPPAAWREHEAMHCDGHDHEGESTLRDAWAAYKAHVAGDAVAKAAR